MCGIAGVVSARSIDRLQLARMAGALAHRGPDDEGLWIDAEAGIGLAHRRLSIVDLSPHGHQPMASASGRWLLCYNGEIYNHLQLRRALDGEGAAPSGGWRGHSDTETLIAAIEHWGLESSLARIVGMFAFALWDRETRTLRLVRDRFGEKPLYYGWAGRDFVFASELKALRTHPDFDATIDRRALRAFAARTYVPAPHSIWRRVYKLVPGCILTVEPAGAAVPLDEPPVEGRAGGVRLERYWSYRDAMLRGAAEPIADEAAAIEALDTALAEAIRGQSVADVPVGAFLSGGIDSSTVAALYQRHSATPARTFSIGFAEAGFDEAPYARAVAQHLGTVHHEHVVGVREAQDVIPLLPSIYDEPFADSSQIPTYIVSRVARAEVTVALTGDGGDELFAGYNRHVLAPALWRRLERVPRSLRAVGGGVLGQLPAGFWQGAAGLLPGRRAPHLGAKLRKALRIAGAARGFDDVYLGFLNEWNEGSPVHGDAADVPFDMDAGPGAPHALRMMLCDTLSYLPDDILCKVDRASMAVSLESRVPFLDHRVAELAAHIPLSLKVRGGVGKHVLRELLFRHVPRALFDRPKAGFAVPVGEWVRGPLRPWAEELLEPRAMAAEGYFDAAIVQRRWQAHLSGRNPSTPAIWGVLMFQAWLRAQGADSRPG